MQLFPLPDLLKKMVQEPEVLGTESEDGSQLLEEKLQKEKEVQEKLRTLQAMSCFSSSAAMP